MDRFTPQKRSDIMSKIRAKNTKPEIKVRSTLHKLGFRFRLHRRDLPGTPDIVLSRYKTVIFVHGCFWHCHQGCKDAGLPKTNINFWREKLEKNIERDRNNLKLLGELGWRVVEIWDCETKNLDTLSLKFNYLLRHIEIE